MFTLPSLKKKFKRQKKGGFKRCFLSLGKGAAFGHVLVFYSCPKSKSMVLRKTGSPVKQKQNLVVSYRKKGTPQVLALILCIALLKNFLCQKKRKNKKTLQAGV